MGSLTPHIELLNKEGICETVPTVYSPYPRRLEPIADVIIKAALSPQLREG